LDAANGQFRGSQ